MQSTDPLSQPSSSVMPDESPPSSPPTSPPPITLSLSSSNESLISNATALTPNRGTINWSPLLVTVAQIQRFLSSLDQDYFGTGFVCYKEEEFYLVPASNWTNNHTIQWLINRKNDNATFEGVKGAFIELKNKVDGLKLVIDQFMPNGPEDCPDEVQELALKFVGLRMIVLEIASKGLKQLYQNYKKSWNKKKKPVTLLNKGKESFDIIQELQDSLIKKIIEHRPDFYLKVQSQKDHPHASVLISQRDQYRETIKATFWSPQRGTVISEQLIVQSIRNFIEPKPIPEELKLAAKSLQLPRLAEPIHPHRTKYAWIPVRPEVDEHGQIVFQKGVYGTCERNPIRFDTVCNLYYIYYEDVRQLVLGCGAIDNSEKARQIVRLLERELGKCTTGRVVIHQLNSWFTETNLMRDVHSQVGFLEENLKRGLPGKHVKVLHFNTAFNAATKLSKIPLYNEDLRSVNEINIDSMAQLLQCVHEDLHLLVAQSQETPDEDVDFLKLLAGVADGFIYVKEEPKPLSDNVDHPSSEQTADNSQTSDPTFNLSHPLVFDLLSNLSDKCTFILELVENIREVKQQLRSDSPVFRDPSMSSSSSNDEDPTVSMASSSDAGMSPLRESSDSPILQQDLLSNTPTPVRILSHQLKQNQLKLTQELKDVAVRMLPELIAFFQKCKMKSSRAPIAEKAILILSILKEIYQVQLKIPGEVFYSRCSEVELFLLLYRLLKINPIITCWSGLDRSGYVRSMADAQIEMERIIFERMVQENSELDPSLAQVRACEQIFRMIKGFDRNREILFVETKNILISNGIAPAIDQHTWESAEPTQINIKEKLFETLGLKNLSSPDFQMLKDTQDYLELVNRHLIIEILRTEASTGAPGLKYQHSASVWRDPFQVGANPHALERMPFFIQTESGKYIQMLHYSPPLTSWNNPTMSFTPLGMWLIERLSQLRGT